MKTALIAGIALALTAGALTAGAALAYDAASDVAARKAGMKSIGAATKGLGGALGDKDVAKVKDYAAQLNRLAGQTGGWFPAGSGPSGGEKTKAKAEIWTDAAGFAAARANLVSQAAKMNAAAQSGDLAAAGAAFGDLRGACKSCHDKYQQ